MSTMSKEFAASNQIGKIGEREFVKRCENWGYQVTDVSANTEYQTQDIDFLVQPKQGQEIKVEVKSDTFSKTGNMFLETISNEGRGTPGWMQISKADILVYMFINGLNSSPYDVFWVDFKALKELNLNNFRERQVRAQTKITKGRTVPVIWLMKKGVILKAYNWGFSNNPQAINQWE